MTLTLIHWRSVYASVGKRQRLSTNGPSIHISHQCEYVPVILNPYISFTILYLNLFFHLDYFCNFEPYKQYRVCSLSNISSKSLQELRLFHHCMDVRLQGQPQIPTANVERCSTSVPFKLVGVSDVNIDFFVNPDIEFWNPINIRISVLAYRPALAQLVA